MTYTTETMSAETAEYGGLVDAIGGIATVILAIVALAGVTSQVLLPIAIIVFGAALMIQGGTMLSEYALALSPRAASSSSSASSQPDTKIEQLGSGGVSALFFVGASGIVLGILALLGIAATELTSVAVIAFGAAMVLSSNSVRQIYLAQAAKARTSTSLTSGEFIAGEMAAGSAGIHMVAGLTAIVLGILAVAGNHAATMSLVALLVLGATVVMSGGTLSGLALGFMRSSSEA